MDCAYCKYVNFETSNPQDRNKLLNKPFVTQHTVINGNEMFELELNLGYFKVVSRREINNCPMCGEKLHKIEKIEKGDLVIKKGKNEARTYFVEDIDEFGILLVDGIQDMYYEEDELYKFYQQYRLLCRESNPTYQQERQIVCGLNYLYRLTKKKAAYDVWQNCHAIFHHLNLYLPLQHRLP